MIVLKIKGKKYTISENLSVTDGEYKFFLEHYIKICKLKHRTWMGSFSKFLYINLQEFKYIEIVSFDYNPPDDKNVRY